MITNQQKEKAERFLQYHHDPELLVLLNSWDAGTSKLAEACGFKAVATTSMGIAASLGYPDCQVIQLHEMLKAIELIVNSVNVPVTADVEAGYGRNTEEVISSMKQIIATGVVGINIEDSMDMSADLMDVSEFCERISAIRRLSDELGMHLVINARTDAFYTGTGTEKEKLASSILRGNKYKEAGADCIFVQPVWNKELIATLVKEIDAPLNILSNPGIGDGLPPSVKELLDLGVARLSLGSGIMKASLVLMKRIADELSQNGTYQLLSDTLHPLEDASLAYRMAVGSSTGKNS